MQFMPERKRDVDALVAEMRGPWRDKVTKVDGIVDCVAQRSGERAAGPIDVSCGIFGRSPSSPRETSSRASETSSMS
jgi:hypothetical protein